MMTLSDKGIEYLSVAEAARRLGKTAPYLYKLISLGKLPYYLDVNERKMLRWDEVVKTLTPRPANDQDEE